ncbi:MAG: DNA methylase [[Eubacterium] sulci]|jgi:nucleotidyltransferase/DNA polymerase involved in DNA repair|nr:DNA methylase [[Eubacterium] sulci]MBF1168998.1 DNA methylase [[Eubacterium] sulci]MBF1170918.1 DNA methylase [[Eubacterium] sulci]
MRMSKTYISIDLKSFYASVECMERGLDPLNTNLVVADASRTQKTICLAVSPSLKAYGIPGRARLFEVEQKVKEANARRQTRAPKNILDGKSVFATELNENPCLAIDYIAAKPRMALYMSKSTQIYDVYLRYIAPEDIYAYSVDEVFIDASGYLKTYGLNAHDFARLLVREVFKETGITATAGIGPNLYLCKIAMDIGAKHTEADADGVRIAELDEYSYRRLLWDHRPITDFWRVGRGYAKKLAKKSIFTMGDIARCSLGTSSDYYNEDLLYKMFGVNAELLIDHAWGYEPCTLAEVKSYRPQRKSLVSGQVLQNAYTYEKTRIVVREMMELLALDLVDKGLLTNQIVLTVGYDIENLSDPERRKAYKGEITVDGYGREVPKHAHGTGNLPFSTASTKLTTDCVLEVFDRVVDESLLTRRISITVNNLVLESEYKRESEVASAEPEQISMFDMLAGGDDSQAPERVSSKEATVYSEQDKPNSTMVAESILGSTGNDNDEDALEKEKQVQEAMLKIKKRFGKNAILKGTNLQEGATAKERNAQIGGHKA